jgi:hypothetical protein
VFDADTEVDDEVPKGNSVSTDKLLLKSSLSRFTQLDNSHVHYASNAPQAKAEHRHDEIHRASHPELIPHRRRSRAAILLSRVA